MKVKITSESKKWMTIAELPIARQIIAEMKDDDDAEAYVQMAARLASGIPGERFEVLKVDAEIARSKAWNVFSDDSGNLDIYIRAYAFSSYAGFYDIGFYISSMWKLSDENRDEIKAEMFINEYKPV